MQYFYIRELVFSGETKDPVKLEFKKGLNVISGASQTGKTYAFQSIDYMFGASNPPKKIKESNGYTEIEMLIERTNGERYLIKRKLIGKVNKVYVQKVGLDNWKELGSTHSAENTSNISRFLQELIGITTPIQLLKNKNNEKKTLSFRDISRLFQVNENEIIKEESPFFSGIVTNRTAEKSVLKFFLTNEDDTKFKTVEDTKIERERCQAILNFINGEIERYQSRLNELTAQKIFSLIELNKIDNLKESFSSLNTFIKSQSVVIKNTNHSIAENYEKIHRMKNLDNRFHHLLDQYISDIERLDFLDEGALQIKESEKIPCPICDNEFAIVNTPDAEVFKIACDAERNNIIKQKSELECAMQDIKNQIISDLEEEKKLVIKMEILEIELLKAQEKLEDIYSVLEENQEFERQIAQKEFFESEIQKNEEQLIYYKEKFKLIRQEKTLPVGASSVNYFDDLTKVIQKILVRWEFNQGKIVEFDTQTFDITIDEFARSSFGKGYRALLYMAILVAYMEHMTNERMIHPGIVIADSPVVTLKEKDDYEYIVSKRIKNKMFEDLSDKFKDFQIIVFENDQIPSEISEKVHCIYFSGNKNFGRYGLFPTID